MTTFKTELVNLFRTNPNILAFFGDRISPSWSASGVIFPKMIFTRITSPPEHHQGGSSGLVNPLYTFKTYSLDSVEVETGAEVLRNLFDGFRGKMGQVFVNNIFLQDERDDIERPTDNSQEPIFFTEQDFSIWHQTSIPTLT